MSPPNIPREIRPVGATDVVGRYSQNPIIRRDLIPSANGIFNSAVVPDRDGIQWQLDDAPIEWACDDREIAHSLQRHNPRAAWIEDRDYLTWCND